MIEKYLNAFPYSMSYVSENSEYLFYLEVFESSKKLMCLDLKKSNDRSDGKNVCQEDFSKRSFEIISYDSSARRLYIVSDDNNKENYNLYYLNLDDGKLSQLTNSLYCGIYGFSKDMKKLVYGNRWKTENGKFFNKVYLRDMETEEEKIIADDETWDYRFGWARVVFDEAKENVFLTVDKDNTRKLYNIIKINLKSLAIETLLPKEYECPTNDCVGKYIDNNNLYFVSEFSGFENVFHLDLITKKVTKLTDFKKNPRDHSIDKNNQIIYTIIPMNEKDETHLQRIELNGAIAPKISTFILKGSHYSVKAQDFWMLSSNMDLPATLSQYEVGSDLIIKQQINGFRGSKDELVHNSYRYTEYKTFDGKTVSAFLSLPKGKIRGAVITAFYGGNNHYSWQTQLFAELGLVVFSPAVRGSWSQGLEWRNLLRGDLGGNEILDVHWGARFLEKEFNLTHDRIGVEGGSHGGYSVLRAMTMPEGFNGIKGSSYPYSFGICWAGFADLEDFYKTSNIPDWLVDMLGPYESNIEKYRERSPIHFFENLKAPLFVSHGTNDPRVSPTSMQGFIDKLQASSKDYVLHLMEGLGHGGGDRKETLDLYEKLVNFVKRVIS
jgi:dipeptidyl aminopeptidase/acylaminoacyl peptidase